MCDGNSDAWQQTAQIAIWKPSDGLKLHDGVASTAYRGNACRKNFRQTRRGHGVIGVCALHVQGAYLVAGALGSLSRRGHSEQSIMVTSVQGSCYTLCCLRKSRLASQCGCAYLSDLVHCVDACVYDGDLTAAVYHWEGRV